MKKIILLITLFATHHLSAAGWTGPQDVTNVNVYGSFILVRLGNATNDQYNPDGCSHTDKYVHLAKSHPSFSELYVLLMTAAASNKRVNIQVSTCAGDNRPRLNAVSLWVVE